jgi:phosphate-selective porin
MKKIFLILFAIGLFVPQWSWAQGCMESTSDEGVQVIGYIQPEFRYDFMGTDELTGESMDQNSFYFNRMRLGVVGNIPYDFSYYAIAELSPTLGGPFILDAYISYNRFGPWAKISVGQFKNPFGLELSTPCHKLHTINRSEAVSNLAGPFRDFGVMVSGGTDTLSILGSKTKNLFGYQLALMNGNGMNVQDNNSYKDFIGRVTFHPFEFITLGASFRKGRHPAADPTATEEDVRERLGLEVELNYKNFLVQGEYIQGSDIGSYTTGGGCGDPVEIHEGSVDREGYFVQAMYMTPWNIQPVVKYEYYEPNKAADVLNDQISTITYGLNIFPNEWTRLQINYLYNVEENGTVEFPNDALLIQAQVVF